MLCPFVVRGLFRESGYSALAVHGGALLIFKLGFCRLNDFFLCGIPLRSQSLGIGAGFYVLSS